MTNEKDELKSYQYSVTIEVDSNGYGSYQGIVLLGSKIADNAEEVAAFVNNKITRAKDPVLEEVREALEYALDNCSFVFDQENLLQDPYDGLEQALEKLKRMGVG